MDILKELFNLLTNLELEDAVTIQFSDVNGKKKLLINDKEVEITECPIKKVINKYKEDIKALDDDTFIEVAERLEDQLDFCKLDELINKDNITKEDSEDIQEALDIIYDEINSVIDERIKNLVKLKERFEVQ